LRALEILEESMLRAKAAAFEAALLPGIVLGVAAMWLPQYFPKRGRR
jgi:hypothetical protein